MVLKWGKPENIFTLAGRQIVAGRQCQQVERFSFLAFRLIDIALGTLSARTPVLAADEIRSPSLRTASPDTAAKGKPWSGQMDHETWIRRLDAGFPDNLNLVI